MIGKIVTAPAVTTLEAGADVVVETAYHAANGKRFLLLVLGVLPANAAVDGNFATDALKSLGWVRAQLGKPDTAPLAAPEREQTSPTPAAETAYALGEGPHPGDPPDPAGGEVARANE